MAIRKIEIRPKGDGTYADVLYPKTSVDMVEGAIADTNYIRQPGFATTAGTANAYTVDLSPNLPAYVDGVAVSVKVHASNTGASTINVDGLGAKNILDSKGVALSSGKLALNSVYTLRYNGTAFILQGEGGELDEPEKQSLIDIANEAEANNSTIRSNVATSLDAVSTVTDLGLTAASTWTEIQNAIPNVKTGKRFIQVDNSSPGVTIGAGSFTDWMVTGLALPYVPSIVLSICQNDGGTATGARYTIGGQVAVPTSSSTGRRINIDTITADGCRVSYNNAGGAAINPLVRLLFIE